MWFMFRILNSVPHLMVFLYFNRIIPALTHMRERHSFMVNWLKMILNLLLTFQVRSLISVFNNVGGKETINAFQECRHLFFTFADTIYMDSNITWTVALCTWIGNTGSVRMQWQQRCLGCISVFHLAKGNMVIRQVTAMLYPV